MSTSETVALERVFTRLTLDELEALLRALVPQLDGLAEGLDESGFLAAIAEGIEEDPLFECNVQFEGKDESFLLQIFDEDEERFEAVFILAPEVAAQVRGVLPPGAAL